MKKEIQEKIEKVFTQCTYFGCIKEAEFLNQESKHCKEHAKKTYDIFLKNGCYLKYVKIDRSVD